MDSKLKMLIPKGRIQGKVLDLLSAIGLSLKPNERSYRPASPDSQLEAKMLKPQNIPMLVALGRHDCGFTGRDWVTEQQADVVDLIDLGFDPVRIVAAVPDELALSGNWRTQNIVVASEYRRITKDYMEKASLDGVFVQAYGATEALPPDDADMIVDNVSTGETLRRNRLTIVDELMSSTTIFVCSKKAYEDPLKRRKLDELTMLMKSSLDADQRVLLEMNVSETSLEALVNDLPCMRSPTVAALHNGGGYAVKIAVPSSDVPRLIPQLIERGARDILEYKLEKIVVEGS
jgi:ATP phosphoribosyltransferase